DSGLRPWFGPRLYARLRPWLRSGLGFDAWLWSGLRARLRLHSRLRPWLWLGPRLRPWLGPWRGFRSRRPVVRDNWMNRRTVRGRRVRRSHRLGQRHTNLLRSTLRCDSGSTLRQQPGLVLAALLSGF